MYRDKGDYDVWNNDPSKTLNMAGEPALEITMPGLNVGKYYRVRMTAVNPVGESVPGPLLLVHSGAGRMDYESPGVVRHTKRTRAHP